MVVTYCTLHFQKKQIRKEIKWKIIEGIDKEELVLLKFDRNETLTQLNWKHSKEFEYQGEMYDIVETKIEGDTIYYWCWWDHEETEINKRLKEIMVLAPGKHPMNKDSQYRLLQFFNSLFFTEADLVISNLFIESKVNNFFALHPINCFSGSPPTPPPELYHKLYL